MLVPVAVFKIGSVESLDALATSLRPSLKNMMGGDTNYSSAKAESVGHGMGGL